MKDRLLVAGAIGGFAVLVVMAALVLKFGIKDPSPPSLEDDPNPGIAGQVAYTREDGCIVVAEASGASRREVTCVAPNFGVNALTWVDSGTLAFATYTPAGVDWTALDIATGEETEFGTADPASSKPLPNSMTSPRGDELYIDYDSGDVFRRDGTDRVRIFEFDGPDNWAPEFITWSPDGEWVLLRYQDKQELWIIRRDGSFAGTLAGNAWYSGTSWWMDGFPPLPATELPLPE